MNDSTRSFVFILPFCLLAAEACGVEVPLTDTTVVHLADERLAAERLGQLDTFVESLSPFDRSARLQTDRPVNREEFLRFVSAQALSWNEEETARIAETIGSIRPRLAPYAAHFPETILLVKTTGREEGDAAYCRHDDVIVLPQKMLQKAPRPLDDLLIHELFHILSRNDPELRDALYRVLGYTRCPEIELPESLRPRKITNPDAPVIEHYLEVRIDGQAVPVVPALFSSGDYDAASGRTFFAYLTFRLLVIEKADGEWRAAAQGDEPWLLEASDVRGFYEQIGRNTSYIIHPEEVLAENFVLLVKGNHDVPSPEIIERMGRILSER